MTRKHERRLQRFLRRNQLLFVRVGGRASEDRVIATFSEASGGTRSNREYNTLIRAIVTCVLEP